MISGVGELAIIKNELPVLLWEVRGRDRGVEKTVEQQGDVRRGRKTDGAFEHLTDFGPPHHTFESNGCGCKRGVGGEDRGVLQEAGRRMSDEHSRELRNVAHDQGIHEVREGSVGIVGPNGWDGQVENGVHGLECRCHRARA